MRQPVLTILGFTLGMLPAVGHAASIEIAPMIGYQFGGGTNTDGGEFGIDAAPGYNIILDYAVREGAFVELYYSYQDTTLTLQGDDLPSDKIGLKVHYLQLGGSIEPVSSRYIRPFLSMTLGATLYSADLEGSSTEARFSGIIGGGVKIPLTDWLGLRAQGEVRLNFLGGGDFLCVNAACIGSVGTVSLQGSVQGGAFVTF
jgi:hypothetical protein